METMTSGVALSSLPVGLLVALAVLFLLEVALDVVALVDLYRRPIDRITLGSKWVWALIIIVVNLVGAILYFAIGRKPAALTDEHAPPPPPAANRTTIVDALYGPRDDSDKS